MVALTQELTVAKKKMGRPPKGRNDVSVRLDLTVKNRAEIIAKLSNKTLSEWLSDTLGPITEKELAKVLRQMGTDTES